MKIKMPSEEGLTLKTAGTYCAEDIEIVPTFETGGSNIVIVDELPTTNIQENTIYKVEKVSNIEVYTFLDFGTYTFDGLLAILGISPPITYYVVDTLPTNPQISDLATYSQFHIYIYNDIAYLYGNAGYGNMWLTASVAISHVVEVPLEDKGRTTNIANETEYGVYVFYIDNQIGVSINQYNGLYLWQNGDWQEKYPKNLFHQLVSRTISKVTTKDLEGVTSIGNNAFQNCKGLPSIGIPDSVTSIGDFAFNNTSITSIIIPNSVTYIGSGAFWDTKLELVDFRNATQIPTIGSNVFENLSPKIVVPDSLYDEWIIATNWVVWADYIVKASEYTE